MSPGRRPVPAPPREVLAVAGVVPSEPLIPGGVPLNSLIPEHLERGSLAYQRIGPEHSEDVAALLLDPLVGRTLWATPQPPGPEQVRRRLEAHIDHWHRHGFGFWALHDGRDGGFVGWGGLLHSHIDGTNVVEVGWALLPSRWGRGLATEVAIVSVELAFSVLQVDQLVAITRPDNLASRRVMEKSGFTYARDIEHAGLPHVLYVRAPPSTRRPRC
jgi:RimJ/RimL family protein N-acetyltransferase